MSNFANIPPRQKRPRAKPDPAYLEEVSRLPCVVCMRSPCEAHHPIHDRFSARKADDRDAIPLCPDCHRELHANKRSWREMHGPDYGYSEQTRRTIDDHHL